MKVSPEKDNNFGYEQITILKDNMPVTLTQIIVHFIRKKHCRLTNQAKSLPLQREFGGVALLEFVPRVQLIPYIYPAFVPFGRFLPRVDTFSFAQDSHVVYCF
jgi:hypothetical protein